MTLLVRFGWEQENNSVNRGQLPVSDITKSPRKHLFTSSGNSLSLSFSLFLSLSEDVFYALHAWEDCSYMNMAVGLNLEQNLCVLFTF